MYSTPLANSPIERPADSAGELYRRTDISPEQFFQPLGRARRAARDEIERLIALLDDSDLTGLNWVLALCRKKKFSEYLLYGHFVANSLAHLASHHLTEDGIVVSHWDDTCLDRSAIEAMMKAASPDQAALCIQSYSSTSIDYVFRLHSRDRGAPNLAPDQLENAALD